MKSLLAVAMLFIIVAMIIVIYGVVELSIDFNITIVYSLMAGALSLVFISYWWYRHEPREQC